MTYSDIFRKLNTIPRPSHHEGLVADFLCQFAAEHNLEYERDAENCVVIRKPATAGYEDHDTIVLLNHMDMVAVGDGSRPFDPLKDGIEAYVEDGWMKARGTSLGADNGIGLSMALAVLAADDIAHPALEVLTTTNEEDGMSGAAALATDFIKGRKVINLDSEDYDTITVGAAGAYLQVATFKPHFKPTKAMKIASQLAFFKVTISGGAGGHSGVDINKGRCNAIHELSHELFAYRNIFSLPLYLSEINGGSANASIPGNCSAVVGVMAEHKEEFLLQMNEKAEWLKNGYCETDPDVRLTVEAVGMPERLMTNDDFPFIIANLPCGVIRMREDMEDTVMTSNNIGVVKTTADSVTISCHTRSFSDDEMVAEATAISEHFKQNKADVEVIMNTPGWQENQESDYMKLVDTTFNDVLRFHPRKVAMHFVLEAGYYVQKYPGIEIACIGPRIVEPHSTKERVDLQTVEDIWQVLVELLKRL